MASSASPYPSPASSSTSLSSPTKENLRSNPHPYAIKTTSTGILSRSSSTRSSASVSHHFVPSSPTKHKSSSVKPRPSGHKYSRSLNTNELPRPLPIPPNFPSSSSPTRTEFDTTDIPVLSRRDRRADTLPSASQPNLLGGLTGMDDLPDDPRIWSPSQLSTYLASSLRVTSGDLPPLVAQDIAIFVRAQKITGKKFLRLTEGDLDEYGLNQRWQSALLGASRLLRRDSIRGRIWNPVFHSDQPEDDNENYSSTSSISSSGSVNDLQRGRPGNGSGRVKGMVASFERSVSPTKDSPTSRRSMSPVKKPDNETASPDVSEIRSRPRPQSDIFPSRSSYSTTTPASDFIPTTTTATTPPTTMTSNPDTEQKKEPRLLPYPPSPAFTSSPQPNQTHVQGLPAYGPYSPPQQLLPQDTATSFSPFPSGVLPFSPQSTGTGMSAIGSPDHLLNPIPINPGTGGGIGFPPTTQQQQSFSDALYPTIDGVVRPLPLPPHPGQFYQPLASAASVQGYGGIVIDNDRNGENAGMMMSMYSSSSPHELISSGSTLPITVPVPVPHVEVQHVVESSQQHQTQALMFDSQLAPHHHPSPPHQQQQQQNLLHPLPQQPFQPQQQQVQILSPQPRHGGRESPTKILEEKLEELLEPRPRSRIFPGQPGLSSPSHSRVASVSGSASPSRPRSRVTSMNLTGGGTGSVRLKNGAAVVGEKKSNGSIGGGDNATGATTALGMGSNANAATVQHPRTRVISLSSRTHSHRLSGVEVWGENHRHVVLPSSSDDKDLITHRSNTIEDGIGGSGEVVEGVGGVKDLESEEEVGIEAVLEKGGSISMLPVSELEGSGVVVGGGHGKDGSSGSSVGGTTTHSRTGSVREPKSAVITVVERIPSSSKLRNDVGGYEEDEGEESMETLLAKAELNVGSGGSMRRKKRIVSGTRGDGGGGGTKRRTPLNGADAWEMINVDTVKHVEGEGMGRSIEDIFSTPRSSATAAVTNTATASIAGPGASSSSSPQQQPPSSPLGPRQPPSPQIKAKLKPKIRRKQSDIHTEEEELDKREEELEKKMVETRKMVEEVRVRLENVEKWIGERERKVVDIDVDVDERKRSRSGGMGVGGLTMDVMKRVFKLSASRVPGMVGLSAWFGASSTLSSSSSPSNTSSSSSSSSSSTNANNTNAQTKPLIRRFAKLGLNLSTYAVLFGIGMCVVMLRLLGRRPGTGAGGFGFGRVVGHGIGNGVLRR